MIKAAKNSTGLFGMFANACTQVATFSRQILCEFPRRSEEEKVLDKEVLVTCTCEDLALHESPCLAVQT